MDLLEILRGERAQAQSELDTLLVAPAEEKRDLNDDEAGRFTELTTSLERLDSRLAELAEMVERRRVADEAAVKITSTAPAVVKSEPRTYPSPAEHRGGPSFFSDMYRAQIIGDSMAAERIGRHQREMEVEQRAVTSGGVGAPGGLVPPQWLEDLFAPIARAGRPTANICNRMPLPDEGLTLNIPRVTTGTATAVQATENTAVQNTDIVVQDLAVNVRTIAGQSNISRQSLERGTPGVDELIFQDLGAAFAANLDNQILNGSGSGGQMLGILNTSGTGASTYTDASPTVPEIYSKLADGAQQVNSNRFYPPNVVIMHPRRWGWFTASLDTANRPLVVPIPTTAYNPVAVGEAAGYGTPPVGNLMGLDVITDANIPTNLGAGTNEDRIIIARREDLLLWELGDGTPRQLRFEQTLGNALEVVLVLYSYAAFTAGRYPAATSIIAGTGLVTPTF